MNWLVIPDFGSSSAKYYSTNLPSIVDFTATQLDQMRIERSNIPSAARSKINQRFRNFESDIDVAKRKLKTLSDDRKALFGNRYSDNATADDQLEQQQQLLSGTERLDRSSQRLRNAQITANETEGIGRDTLADLQVQRETIQHTRITMLESEGYVDRSVKTLRGMGRRYFCPLSNLKPTILHHRQEANDDNQDGYESDYNHCDHYRPCITDNPSYI